MTQKYQIKGPATRIKLAQRNSICESPNAGKRGKKMGAKKF